MAHQSHDLTGIASRSRAGMHEPKRRPAAHSRPRHDPAACRGHDCALPIRSLLLLLVCLSWHDLSLSPHYQQQGARAYRHGVEHDIPAKPAPQEHQWIPGEGGSCLSTHPQSGGDQVAVSRRADLRPRTRQIHQRPKPQSRQPALATPPARYLQGRNGGPKRHSYLSAPKAIQSLGSKQTES